MNSCQTYIFKINLAILLDGILKYFLFCFADYDQKHFFVPW